MAQVRTAVAIDDGPCAFRFPRGAGFGVTLADRGDVLPIGKGRVLREGDSLAILSYGTRLQEALAAAEALQERGVSVTIADARFAKPLDEALIRDLVRAHEAVITIEEGSIGGFGSQVLHFLASSGLLDTGIKIRTKVLPDLFIDQDKPERQYAAAGLLSSDIVATALDLLGATGLRA